jgi:glycosyltransferase involved in cell wall biosynthesis
MKNEVGISVLMPVYNCELYIYEAVESIINQTYKNFEFIIIDDCSTDNTVNICKSFNDERIIIIEKKENTGLSISLNYGISISRGKYIARMDGDDISLPTRFEKQVAFMEANADVVVCGATFQIINSKETIFVPEKHNQIIVGMLQECKIAHPTVMFRNSFLKLNNLVYDIKMEPAEDYDLWVKIGNLAKLHNMQEVLLYYRTHEGQVSNANTINQIARAKEIRWKLIKNLKANWTDFEKETILKVFSREKFFTKQEILYYFKTKSQLKNNSIFEAKEFQIFLNEVDRKLITSNFKFAKNYNPSTFYLYLKIKNFSNFKLNSINIFKIVVKCVVFYKVP